MCASVGAEKLGGGSCPNRGPTAVSSSILYHCLAMVSSPFFRGRVECSFVLFFELVFVFGRVPCQASGASLLSFCLFVGPVLQFHSVGVDLPSQNLVQNRQYRDTVTCLPAHTEQRSAKVAEVRVICTRSGSIVILLPPTHQQGSRNNQGHQMNQRCTIMTKLVLCSEPHACAQTAGQQRRIVR